VQTVGNILWLIFVGLWLAIGFVVAGIVMFILIITIPFGIQAFKMAGFALWPFGRHVEYTDRVTSPLQIIGNIIWIILAGLYLAVNCLVGGVILCITIIGIPFGIQSFKLIPVVLMPFGAVIVSDRATGAVPAVA
jgi:uncharacterized membrane protein YccF (DUF307 family)